MEVLDIDWKNIDSMFVKDDFYEDIQAPKWLDFLAPEEPVDDDAWFCKPDCKHPKNAANLVRSPLIPSPKVRRPRSASSSTSVSVSSISPLGDRTASNLNGKRTRGPLSVSVTSLYELKSKENASENLKISSSLDKKYGVNSKLQSASSKHRGHSENDNPNRPRSTSATPTSGRTLKVQGQKSSVSNSRQNNSVKAAQSPASSQKKGDVKQGLHNVSTDSIRASTPVRNDKQTANKAPANERKSPSTKSGLALKETFSARNLFGRTPGKEFFLQLSEFCSELKKLALNSAQADSASAKRPKNLCKQERNVDKTKEGAQDAKGNCSEFGRSFPPPSSGCPSGRSTHNGSGTDTVTTTSSIGDSDQCTVSDQREQGGLRHRNNTATAKICPKFNEHRKRTNDTNKKENVPPKQQEDDKKDDVRVHREATLKQTLENTETSLSNHDDYRDGTNIPQKVKNRKDFNVSSYHSFSGPILCQQHDIAGHPMDSELQKDGECSNSPNKMVKETRKKPLHAKIFSPNRWKKSKKDSIDQSADCSNCKPEPKVQSCPPSPQKVSRSSQAVSPSSQGKRPKTTPVQPFRFRTMERGILRELESSKKMGRSSASTDNIFATSESKLFLPDVFWFLKRCA